MRNNIFISYSRKDLDAVTSIKEELEANGFSCWMDLEGIVSSSREFTQDIIDAIDASSVFLFFLSANSQVSKWALKEIDYADNEQKHVVLVRINDDSMTKKFRFDFGRTNIIDWRKPEQKEKLLRDLSEWTTLLDGASLETGICRKIILPGGAEMEMIYCPPGEFMMGSSTKEVTAFSGLGLRHSVRLTKGFWLGKYPVTQKQWQGVMGGASSFFLGADNPVDSVSWNDSQEFIAKVNWALNCDVRLPTEAEWEYACLAQAADSSVGKIEKFAWYRGNSGGKTHPVGRKNPNAWGIYDMLGNVCEWCADWYGGYSLGDEIDPIGPPSGSYHVRRGGSWCRNRLDCCAVRRYRGASDNRNYDCGFRICCSTMSTK